MGIKDLWPFINSKGCNHLVPTWNLRNIIKRESCRVAADAFHLCYKYYSSEWLKLAPLGCYDRDIVTRGAISRIVDLVGIFISNCMNIVMCVDGDKNPLKVVTGKRSSSRNDDYKKIVKLYQESKALLSGPDDNSLSQFAFLEDYTYVLTDDIVTSTNTLHTNINKLKSMLNTTVFYPKGFIDSILNELVKRGIDVCGIPSISEGEKLCSILVSIGYCEAVYSGDSDSIVLGTRCVIRSINRDVAEVYFYEDILEKLKMSDHQFLGMCIGIGSDYSNGAAGMGIVKCEIEVRNKDFDIHQFNLKFCGEPRANTCIEAFRITDEEITNTIRGLYFR